MKTMIEIYLLTKSALRGKFTKLDVRLAQAIQLTYVPETLRKIPETFWVWVPTWLQMIAKLKQEVPLPEAFTDFLFGIREDLRACLSLGRTR